MKKELTEKMMPEAYKRVEKTEGNPAPQYMGEEQVTSKEEFQKKAEITEYYSKQQIIDTIEEHTETIEIPTCPECASNTVVVETKEAIKKIECIECENYTTIPTPDREDVPEEKLEKLKNLENKWKKEWRTIK